MEEKSILDFAISSKYFSRGMTAVYYLIDGDEIVYIGKAANVFNRVLAHSKSDKTFDKVAFKLYDSITARGVERREIGLHRPKHNKNSNPDYKRPQKTEISFTTLLEGVDDLGGSNE